MWTRRTSWMLVSIRVEKGPKFWVPLPIWFVGEALRGLWILMFCFPWLSHLPHRIAARHSIRLPQQASLKELVGMAIEMLEGVRRTGPFTLVSVRDGDTAVSVRLV